MTARDLRKQVRKGNPGCGGPGLYLTGKKERAGVIQAVEGWNHTRFFVRVRAGHALSGSV